MIEIFSLIIQLFVIIIFCYVPNGVCLLLKNNNNPDILERLEIGIVINIFILLLLSFILRSGSNLIYYLLIIIFLNNFVFTLIDIFRKYKIKKFEANYIFLTFIFLFFIFSIDISNNLKIGWDAQNYWLAKKLIFTNGGDFFDLKNTPRNEYPYLGSFIWHIYSKFSILGYEYFGRIFYIFTYLIAIFSISSFIKVSTFEKIILIFVIIFLTYKITLFNGYQEILNFSFLIILTKIFYEIYTQKLPIKKFDNKFVHLFILISSIIWIKSESTALVAIFLFSLLLLKEIEMKVKITMALVFMVLLLIKYYIFSYIDLSHEIQKGNYEYFQISNFFNFVNFPRFLLIFKYIFFYLLDNIIYPITLICLLIMNIYDKKNKFVLPFLFMFIFGTCFFTLAFLLNSLPLEWVLWLALDRVIFQTTGLYVILIPLFYVFLKRKKIF